MGRGERENKREFLWEGKGQLDNGKGKESEKGVAWWEVDCNRDCSERENNGGSLMTWEEKVQAARVDDSSCFLGEDEEKE